MLNKDTLVIDAGEVLGIYGTLKTQDLKHNAINILRDKERFLVEENDRFITITSKAETTIKKVTVHYVGGDVTFGNVLYDAGRTVAGVLMHRMVNGDKE